MSKKKQGIDEDVLMGIFPMILAIVKKRRAQSDVVEHDDLVSEGVLALLRSHKKFDPSRKIKLSTFAYRHIDGSIRDFQERQENYVQRVSAVEPEILDQVATENEIHEDESKRQLYPRMIKLIEEFLPDEQGLILVRHYFEGLTFKEISREMNLSIGNVEFLHTSALVKMREAINTL